MLLADFGAVLLLADVVLFLSTCRGVRDRCFIGASSFPIKAAFWQLSFTVSFSLRWSRGLFLAAAAVGLVHVWSRSLPALINVCSTWLTWSGCSIISMWEASLTTWSTLPNIACWSEVTSSCTLSSWTGYTGVPFLAIREKPRQQRFSQGWIIGCAAWDDGINYLQH